MPESTPHRRRRPGAGLALVLSCLASALLAVACGGGGGGGQPAVQAVDDTLTVQRGSSGDVLANDRIDGQPARTGTGGNATVSVVSGPAGWALGADGRASVDDLPVGRHVASYQLCRVAAPAECQTAQLTLDVRHGALAAAPAALQVWRRGVIASVLDHVSEGQTLRPWPSQVTVTADGPLPVGVHLDSNGDVSADDSAPVGTWTGRYRVCPRTEPDACAESTLSIEVPDSARLTAWVGDHVRVEVQGRAPLNANACVTTAGFAQCFVADTTVPGTAVGAGATAVTVGGSEPPVLRTDGQFTVPVQRSLPLVAGLWSTEVLDPLPTQAITPAEGSTSATAGGATLRWSDVLDARSQPVPTPSLLTLTSLGGQAWPLLPVSPEGGSGGSRFEALALGHVHAEVAPLEGQTDPIPRVPRDAVLSLPLLSASGLQATSAPDVAALLRHDVARGRWVDAGQARKVVSDGLARYEAPVTALGTYAVARPYAPVPLSGCVSDAEGRPVAGARLSAEGLDHVGADDTRSGADGRFVLAVRPSSRVRVQAWDADPMAPGDVLGRTSPSRREARTVTELDIGPAGAAPTACLRAEGPARLVLTADVGREVYFSSVITETLVLAPDGSRLVNPQQHRVLRPLVGTHAVYARRATTAPNETFYERLLPAITVGTRERPARRIHGPGPFQHGPRAAGGWWHLADIAVAADCQVSIVARDAVVEELPATVQGGVACQP